MLLAPIIVAVRRLARIVVQQKVQQSAVVMRLLMVVTKRQRLGQFVGIRVRRQARKQAEVEREQGTEQPHGVKGSQISPKMGLLAWSIRIRSRNSSWMDGRQRWPALGG